MKKVFIGVGHGGNDPGAVANGLKESDLNLKQALFLKEILEKNGVEVKLSRYKDENDDVAEEIREANAYNPNLAIDMHTNAGGGNGFEVFHEVKGAASTLWAKYINEEVKKVGYISRGCKTKVNEYGTDYFGFIREVKAPSLITEMAFIDNKENISKFDQDHEIKAYVTCIAKATLKMLGMTYTSTPTKSELVNNEPSIKVGSKVKVIGTKYATGQTVPNWVKVNTYKVIQISSSRALLGGIMSWVYIKDLILIGVATNNSVASFKVGDKVKISGVSYATGQTIPSWVKTKSYEIIEMGSGKALMSGIISWVYLKDLTKV